MVGSLGSGLPLRGLLVWILDLDLKPETANLEWFGDLNPCKILCEIEQIHRQPLWPRTFLFVPVICVCVCLFKGFTSQIGSQVSFWFLCGLRYPPHPKKEEAKNQNSTEAF